MDTVPAGITRAFSFELIGEDGEATPLAAELCYDRRDPYAVAAYFRSGDTEVKWVFARNLLAEGIYEPSGDGDIHVWPSVDAQGRAATVIELASPDGEALIQAQTDELCDFLADAEALVPAGTESEYVDVDGALTKILA